MDRDTFVSIRDLNWDEKKPVVFVHGDVDGMVTACIFLRGRGNEAEVRFTGARRLARDLQALSDGIVDGLPVQEVLIGNVPVRPAAIGAVRQILSSGVPVVWVDHHTTRQNLLDEVGSLDGLTFLHDAEPEGPPSQLAARAIELETDQVERLMAIPTGAESEDPWLQDCHSLLSAQIGRCQPDVLRRLAADEELSDEDREEIASHRAREAAADTLVFETEHPHYEFSGSSLVVVDARGQEVGFLPRRVESRFGEVDLRVIVPDDQTVLLTSPDRSRDLVRLLRALPWPAGVFVGGRPHHARIDPGTAGIDAVMSILTDAASWPADIAAAAARPPREPRSGGSHRQRGGGPGVGADRGGAVAVRGAFEQAVEYRFLAELSEVVWKAGEQMAVYRGEPSGICANLVLELDGVSRRVALFCTAASASSAQLPVPFSMSDMPDACVIWAVADDRGRDRLSLRYRWFGDEPGEPLPPIADLPRGRDPAGEVRMVPARQFTNLRAIQALADRLFGRP